MSGYRCVNYYDLCRLCTASSGTRINIFSAEGKKKNLYQKILECLPVVVDEKDKLPKILCGQCLQQVESIAEFRNVCLNSQTMLESCLNSTTLQNGGKVYIKDATTKTVTSTPTIIKTEPLVTNTSTQSSDFLSSIIQAVGIQSNDDNITESRTQVIPQYTVNFLDGKAVKTGQLEYKVEETTPAQSERQAKHNSLAEFLKMKPNIRVTPIPKKRDPMPPPAPVQQQQQQQQHIQISSTEIQKQKKPKYNLVLASPQNQKTTLIPASQSSTGTKTVSLQDLKILSSNKCFLPITIKDSNSDQQIVAQIDTKNLVLPTTYHLQMKLQPQIATVDGQPIVQLTPTAIPATLSLAPTQTMSTHNYQHQEFQTSGNHIMTSGIDASTSTNEPEIIFSTATLSDNQVPSSITIQQFPQSTSVQTMPKLQITTLPSSSSSQIHVQKQGSITVQRISQHQHQQQQQQQQQQQHQQQQQQQQQQIVKQIKQENQTTHQNTTKQITTKTNSGTGKADAPIVLQECTICGRAFKKKEHLAQHMKLHVGLRPFTCKEPGCNKAFSRKEHLMRHIVSHTGKKMFSCDLCQKLFSRKDNLNKHKRTHTEQTGNSGQFVCEICNKTFVVKMYYIQHKMMHEKNGETANNKLKMVDKTDPGSEETATSGSNNETTIQTINSNQTQSQHVMQLQISTPVVTTSSVSTQSSIQEHQQQTTTAVLKTLGSHDTAVLNLPSNLANLVSINSAQFMTTGEIMGHFKMETE